MSIWYYILAKKDLIPNIFQIYPIYSQKNLYNLCYLMSTYTQPLFIYNYCQNNEFMWQYAKLI